jgi:tetratricopeptide (TPR) repeat protein
VVLIALAGINGVIGARRSIAEREANRMAFGSITAADEARFERALRFAPADPEVLARMGDAEILRFDNARTTADSTDSQGAHLGRARRAYDRLVAITPLWSWGWWGEGQTFARQSAVDRLKEPIPLEGLIRNSEQELPRDAKLALASYRVSIELEPNSYQLQDDLAELYKDEGLRGPALVAYERSARLMPLYYLHSFPPASELPDDIYQAIARGFTQALEDPEAVGVAEIRQGLGEMEQQRGQLAAAEKQFRAGFGTASSALMQGVLAADLGESLRLQGKLQEATPWLERGTRCDAVARQSWMGLGLIRAAQGDHCGARDAYRSAVTASPQEIWPELSYAKETALCGDEAGAIAKLNYMIGAKPPALEARQLLIDLLTKDGKLDDALEQARALLALEPENPSYQKLVAELARQAGASRGGREGT